MMVKFGIIDEYVEALIKTTDDLEKKTIIENLNKIKNEQDNTEDGIVRRNILDYIILKIKNIWNFVSYHYRQGNWIWSNSII